MAVGYAPALANAILNALCRGTAWTPPAALWVQLHLGDPGAAGTANPAVETTRVQATFGVNADGGVISNTADLLWSAVAASEDFTHFSAWDAENAGAFQLSGTVTADPAVTGNDFKVAAGGLVVTLPVAA